MPYLVLYLIMKLTPISGTVSDGADHSDHIYRVIKLFKIGIQRYKSKLTRDHLVMSVLDSAPDTAIFHKFADPKKNDLIVFVF